jgi:hypothetical protein
VVGQPTNDNPGRHARPTSSAGCASSRIPYRVATVSRLADRIHAAGCAPFRPFDLFSDQDMSQFEADLRAQAESSGETPTARSLRAGQPTASDSWDGTQLYNVPVIAGDEVAEYCASFGPGTDPGDVVSVLAPPFDRFFVEFQGVPDAWLNAWGVLIETWGEGDKEEEVRWHLHATLIIEPRKGHPIGPAARWLLALDQEGRWLKNPDTDTTEYVSGVGLVPMSEELPEDVAQNFLARTVPLVLPALMTISFMHCRNVNAREIEPPELLSRKWLKRRGQPLVRYHVLNIGPMRRVLDEQGQARSKGLGHAVHLCRGHFKTFTEEAPLFGRVTGEFWWADQVRGRQEHGVVVKDYRVTTDKPISANRMWTPTRKRPALRPSALCLTRTLPAVDAKPTTGLRMR